MVAIEANGGLGELGTNNRQLENSDIGWAQNSRHSFH